MALSDHASRTPTRCLHAAFDAAAYSGRTSLRQRDLQDRIMAVFQRSVEAVGFDPAALWLQPQGDGGLVRFPRDIDESATVAGLIRESRTELESLNRDLVPDARVRLRLALHVGLSHHAALGLAGDAPVGVSRLVNAPQLRELLARSEESALAVILPDLLYQDLVIQRLRGLDPGDWEPVQVVDTEKGFECSAWMTAPGEPSGPRRTASRRRAKKSASAANAAPAAPEGSALFGNVESVGTISVINGPVNIASGGFTIK